MSRAETFDQLQANIKGITHGPTVDTPAFCDAAQAFAFAYISECHRLGIIGGSWAAMRNTMVLAATQPTRNRCASWELETCSGSDRYTLGGPCPNCGHGDTATGGHFRPSHKRPAHIAGLYAPTPARVG